MFLYLEGEGGDKVEIKKTFFFLSSLSVKAQRNMYTYVCVCENSNVEIIEYWMGGGQDCPRTRV